METVTTRREYLEDLAAGSDVSKAKATSNLLKRHSPDYDFGPAPKAQVLSIEKPVSFRPGAARLKRSSDALEQLVVDSDDRRGGFGERPADCPTATEVYCALMDDFVAKVKARRASVLRILSAKGARYRDIVES